MVNTGLLASGMISAVRHCLDSLLTTDARIIPASATVYAQVRLPVLLYMCKHGWHALSCCVAACHSPPDLVVWLLQ